MRKRYQSRHLNWMWLTLLVWALDIWTKFEISSRFEAHDSIYITSFFNLTHLHNTGAAFSFLSQASGWQNTFFLWLASFISMGVALWLFLSRGAKLRSCGLSLILGGAIGNLWDRLHYGYVVDFLDFHYGMWHWPAFNIADAAITVGAFFVLIDALKSSNGQGSRADEAST